MKTKTLVSLILACAACAQAATYTSEWSAFSSGFGQSESLEVSHTGMFGPWSGETLQSDDYTIEPGPPAMPAEPAPDAPVLTISLVGNNVRVAWPASVVGFVLEKTAALGTASWVELAGPYQSSGTEQFVLVPVSQGGAFYRLRSP